MAGSALFAQDNAVISQTPSATHVDKEGYTVTMASGTATISASATVPATGVILEGQATTGKSSIGILGTISGLVRFKCSGTIAEGARVQQHTDGSVVTDAGTGARVVIGVCVQPGGAVSGDLALCAPHAPLTLS
ncbi:MAG: hypothetical protein RLZZ182_1398 [Pseudomonadota bacterium]|jgi:hypothetical protein